MFCYLWANYPDAFARTVYRCVGDVACFEIDYIFCRENIAEYIYIVILCTSCREFNPLISIDIEHRQFPYFFLTDPAGYLSWSLIKMMRYMSLHFLSQRFFNIIRLMLMIYEITRFSTLNRVNYSQIFPIIVDVADVIKNFFFLLSNFSLFTFFFTRIIFL